LYGQNPGTGTYSFGSFDAKGFDTINLGNLNTHFEIPIVSKSGRGLPFTYSLAYDSLVWSPVPSGGTTYWQPDQNFGFGEQLYGVIVGYLTYNTTQVTCPRPPGWIGAVPKGTRYTGYIYHDPYGRAHSFNYESDYFCPPDTDEPASGTGLSSDGSGYSFDGTYVHTKYGAKIQPNMSSAGSGGSITDSNGNTITDNTNGTYVDTLGVTELTISGTGTTSSPLQLTYPVAKQSDSTTTATATVYYKTYTVQTNFGCSGISEYGPTSMDLVDHITLADSSADTYTFSYEATPGASGKITGRLASITLPTGGVITYTYSGGCGNGINTDGTPATLKRITSDGTKTYTLTNSGAPVYTSSAVDEQGNETDYAFIGSTSGEVYETSRKVYQGLKTGNDELEDRTTAYNGLPSTTQLTSSITQISVTDEYNGLRPSTAVSTYDSNGNQTGSTVEDPSDGNAELIASTATYNALSEVASSQTTDPTNSDAVVSSATYGYDETTPTATSGIPQHSSAYGSYGNQTSSHLHVNGSTSINTTTAYYDTGAVLSTTGPTGTTSYSYDSTQTFATQTTFPTPSSGVTISTSGTFDTSSGIQLSATGANAGQTLTYAQYDRLLRPTKVTTPSPDNGQVTATYTPNQISVITKMSATQSSDQETFLDAYGRTKRVAIANGSGWYLTDSCYNADGLLQYQSTPYFSSSENPSGYQCSSTTSTQYTYDALGRPTYITQADGSSVTTTYNGRAVESSGSNGVSRITQYDLLGRIAWVCEISTHSLGGDSPVDCGSDISGSGYLTTYAYNLSAHTTTVTQGAQTRTFETDAVGRTVQTIEPEAGTTDYNYAYNSTGLAVTRTRPKENQTSSSVHTTTITQYDKLGRILSVTYDDGTPTKTFAYDMTPSGDKVPTLGGYVKGQLVSISTTSGSTTLSQRNYAYDLMGRVSETAECLPGWCGQSSHDVYRGYGYNSASQMITETYASEGNDGTPVSLNYSYNLAGQLTSMTGGQNNATLAPSIYNVQAVGPSGPTLVEFGNGLYAPSTYDAAGQVSGGWVCSGSTTASCTGGTQLYGFTDSIVGHRLTSMTDTVQNEGASFGYDEFGRLKTQTHQSGTNVTSMNWVYDRYGNRTQQNVTAGSGPQPQFSFNTANNQISGYSYDAAGNVTNDGVHAYAYDGENNLISIDGGSTGTFTYDAANERVEVVTSAGTERYGFDAAGRRSTVWDNSTGALDAVQYYVGGAVAYWLASDGNIHFEHQDWVGTERARTTKAGAVEGSYSSLPFGDNFAASGTDTNVGHFAQLDHDLSASSGLEHATFREYSSTPGRWLSPDPYAGSYDQGDPQSMNRYAYVENMPLTDVDPSGQQNRVLKIVGAGSSPPLQFASQIGTPGGAGIFDGGTTCFGYIQTYSTNYSDNLGDSGLGDSGSDFYVTSCIDDGTPQTGVVPQVAPPTAPSNPLSTFLNYEKRVIACNLSTAKKNAVALGLDAAGFIPGERLLGATGGVIAMVGIGVVSTANSAIHGDIIGFFGGQAGTLLAAIAPAAKYAGVSAAESIPGIGTAINIGVTARDIYHGQQDYNACMAGH
jgi:RHS repeat-associated protein